MPKRVSTARGREFGAGLRAAIANAGLTSRAVADILDWDQAKLSDVVNGKGGASSTVCAPVRLRTVVEHLMVAETLTSWHTHMVPVFLQTADYMREVLLASSTAPVAELQDRVEALLACQESLRHDVKCTYFIHELVLYLQVGGAEVHAGQLLHLLHMANRLNVTIRIVPAALGAHAGLAGPFTHLSFPKYEPLVWVETENSSLLVEGKDAIEGYDKVVHALDGNSLDEADSKDLIVRLYYASSAIEDEARPLLRTE